MPSPAISIITPLYNRARLVAETIASVQAQTFADWEMWVVDDGSTDGSYERVAEIAQAEPRLRLLRRDREPKGAPTCRNLGLAAARGEYTIFLDSDDLLAPFCLEQRLEVISQYPEHDFWVFPTLFFKETPGDDNRLMSIPTDEDDLCRFLRFDPPWQTMGPLYHTPFVRQIGGFWEALTYWQDYELHTRALIAGGRYQKFLTARPDTYFRVSGTDRISQHTRAQARSASMWAVVDRHLQTVPHEAYRHELAKGIFQTAMAQLHLGIALADVRAASARRWQAMGLWPSDRILLQQLLWATTQPAGHWHARLAWAGRRLLTHNYTFSPRQHGKHRLTTTNLASL